MQSLETDSRLSQGINGLSIVRFPVFLFLAFAACGATYQATPVNYASILPQLTPGDTVVLAGGTYVLLNVNGLHGSPSAWITITGPSQGAPAVISGSLYSNTV